MFLVAVYDKVAEVFVLKNFFANRAVAIRELKDALSFNDQIKRHSDDYEFCLCDISDFLIGQQKYSFEEVMNLG